MSELLDGAKLALDRAKEKAAPVIRDVRETVADARELAAPAIEDAVDKVKDVAADVREKAAPVVDKVSDVVKEGVEKVGGLFKKDAPAPDVDVKNDFFSELEMQAHMQRNAAQAQAEEMQRRLHEMLHGKKDE